MKISLFSQLLKVYLKDADDLGYGDALTDDDVPDEVINMFQGKTEEEN